jgi:RNA polymerase sigma-70 factor (ECF subfamily)
MPETDMIRITSVDGQGRVPALRVEGRITEKVMNQLTESCETRLENGKGMVLDLGGVTFVERQAAEGLRDLARRGAVLLGCSGYVWELVRPTAPETGAAPEADTSERSFVERLRSGDDAAYSELVRTHGARMLAVARRLLGTDEEAQDAVQEAFLSAFRAIDRFAGDARLSTWLHRIVVNACLMRMRSRRRRPEEPIDELLPRFEADGHWATSPAGWSASADTLLQRRETREIVRRCIDRLPESYRTILLLRDIEDMDTAEVAENLGITANAVKIRLHRARQALRTLLEEALVK